LGGGNDHQLFSSLSLGLADQQQSFSFSLVKELFTVGNGKEADLSAALLRRPLSTYHCLSVVFNKHYVTNMAKMRI